MKEKFDVLVDAAVRKSPESIAYVRDVKTPSLSIVMLRFENAVMKRKKRFSKALRNTLRFSAVAAAVVLILGGALLLSKFNISNFTINPLAANGGKKEDTSKSNAEATVLPELTKELSVGIAEEASVESKAGTAYHSLEEAMASFPGGSPSVPVYQAGAISHISMTSSGKTNSDLKTTLRIDYEIDGKTLSIQCSQLGDALAEQLNAAFSSDELIPGIFLGEEGYYDFRDGTSKAIMLRGNISYEVESDLPEDAFRDIMSQIKWQKPAE